MGDSLMIDDNSKIITSLSIYRDCLPVSFFLSVFQPDFTPFDQNLKEGRKDTLNKGPITYL